MLFKDCICFQLGRVNRKIARSYRNQIAGLGLTHSQFFLLVAILEEEGILPSMLAEKVDLDRPTTSGLLDRLERDGWIERRSDEKDRRILRIFLSTKGRGHRSKLLNLFHKTNRGFLDRFSVAEWDQFQTFLQRLE